MHIRFKTSGNSPLPVTAGYAGVTPPPVVSSGTSGTTTRANPAYVTQVTPALVGKNLAGSDTLLSDGELKQLFSAYVKIGAKDPLWKDIGHLLSSFSGDDRTNFLAVLSRSGDHLKSLVLQLKGLDTSDRSAYLRTALRLDPDQGLENLIQSIKQMDRDLIPELLTAADQLGRSHRSLAADELNNFFKAAADTPNAIGALIRKTSELEKEDRALFLQAAAGAGSELGRLIEELDRLPEHQVSLFLKSAAGAGKGLSNLLDLSGVMDTDRREEMLSFAAHLSLEETEDFLLGTQGNRYISRQLMDTASDMSPAERKNLLALASGAGDNIDRLLLITSRLDSAPEDRAAFLSAAVTAEKGFTKALSLAESLTGEELASVFSFASGLDLVDLTSFLTAVEDHPGQAVPLAETAAGLEDRDRNYFLYAAAVGQDHISQLTTLTSELEASDLSTFLFSAANAERGEDQSQLYSRTAELSGPERSAFLNQYRQDLMETADNPLTRTYVFLNSVFSEEEIKTLLSAGSPEAVDRLVADVQSMDSGRREPFFRLAKSVGNQQLFKLASIIRQMDHSQIRTYERLTFSLDKEGRTDLVTAAHLALKRQQGGPDTLDRLMKIAQSLPEASDGHFLNAAASAGNALAGFMDLTGRLGGMNRTNFLIAADLNADVEDNGRLVSLLVDATRTILDEILGNVLALGPGGIRLDEVIDLETGRFNVKSGSVNLSSFLRSAAFLAHQRDVSYAGRVDWYHSFMGIPEGSTI